MVSGIRSGLRRGVAFAFRIRGVILIAVILASGSCTESLPPFEDPRDIIHGVVRGRYVFRSDDNSLKVDLLLVNTFDETFQAQAILEGEGTLTLRRKPSVQRTFVVTSNHLVSAKYNPSTRVLTMDPGDTVRLVYTWNFIDDNSRDVRALDFSYVQDPDCGSRMIAREETFILRARIKVFDKVGEVEMGPAEISICHINVWLDPRICPPIFPELSRAYCPQ